ncbi:MAG: disulfide bond formation protein DsbA [Rhodoferax sp.]|nr:MAG: disulfide bond formation protein DsbA [Rhodoferax sp.]
MNSKKTTVVALLAFVVLCFVFGMYAFQQRVQKSQMEKVRQTQEALVRQHSPIFGNKDAPVTIVEFFDPACETCRAFYPIVKSIMGKYPGQVRLVMRYAPFHQGSDEVVRLLEAAKKQNIYWRVLEAVLAAQPDWAEHGKPNLDVAFVAAEKAGLDLTRAKTDAQHAEVTAVLTQDVQDLTTLEVTKTPTFFVNGQGLTTFGAEQLAALVAQEVAKVQK